VTVFAILLSLATGTIVFYSPEDPRVLQFLPMVLLVRMALNAIDGMLAREHGMKSNLGGFLNELGDVISDSALYLPLARVPGFDGYLVVLVVVLAVMSEMAGVVAVQIGASRCYDGPMGKSDRAFVLGALALAVGLGVQPARWLTWALAGVLAALALTVVQRTRHALREVKTG
jgi:CDP-diacylglycerol--glycerol-3-phosphate 3-phosphatidyltransferase